MPYIQEQSAGGAFVDSLEGYMQRRELQQRQAEQDALARQREERLNRRAEAELALQEKEATERIENNQRTRIEKERALMEPGDIEPPEMKATAARLGMPAIRLQPPKPFTPPEAPDMLADPNAPLLAAPTPEGTGVLLDRPQEQGYAGTFAQRQKIDTEQKITDIQRRIRAAKPGTDEYQQLLVEYEMEKTGQIPAGAFNRPGAGLSPVMTREQALAAGQVPPNTKIIEPLQPRDTSAADARKQAHLDQVHQQAITEIGTWVKPIQAQLQSIGDLGTAVNARTPQADALIAPLVLKATVSGTGSGFRMTRPEIENVVGGRSKWESLSAALNKWSTDPTQALSITDEQRVEIRSLMKAIREKATKVSRKITDIRHQIDDADDPQTINRLRTSLQEDLMKMDEADDSAAKLTAAELIKKYGGQ